MENLSFFFLKWWSSCLVLKHASIVRFACQVRAATQWTSIFPFHLYCYNPCKWICLSSNAFFCFIVGSPVGNCSTWFSIFARRMKWLDVVLLMYKMLHALDNRTFFTLEVESMFDPYEYHMGICNESCLFIQPSGQLAILHGKNFNVEHSTQIFQP